METNNTQENPIKKKLVSLKQTIGAKAKIKSQSITAIKESFYPSWLVHLTSSGVYPLTVNDWRYRWKVNKTRKQDKPQPKTTAIFYKN